MACNYNPYATEDDGSCIASLGSIDLCEIQYTANQGQDCYASEHDQECWTITGTVTATNPDYPNFYLGVEGSPCDDDIGFLDRGTWSGIYIFGFSGSMPNFGDNITLTGTVYEYYSLTQFSATSFYVLNSTGNSIDPIDVFSGDFSSCSANAESVESMPVQINNVVVTTQINEFGEWYVDDGSGPVMINDKVFDGDWLDPSSSQEFASIVGVVDYAYSEFSILPRTMIDFVYYAPGDLNGDGVLNVLDVVILANAVLTGEDLPAGDINGDGQLNILDIVQLVNIILG